MSNLLLTDLSRLIQSTFPQTDAPPFAIPANPLSGQGFSVDRFEAPMAGGTSDPLLELNPQGAPHTPAQAGATGVVRQDTDSDCGAAAVTMLVRARGKESGKSDSEVMQALDKQFAKGDGTTPQELSDMLAHEGFQVTQGSFQLDQGALDAALANGDKVLALVDSNKIRPGSSSDTGKLHWVVVDKKENGQYQIKDPADGSTYPVDKEHLMDAMSAGWQKHQGGGMLIAHDLGVVAKFVPESFRAYANAKHADALGHNGGTGSRVRQYNGLEA